MLGLNHSRSLLVVVLLAGVVLPNVPAEAAKLHFGKRETLHEIASTKLMNGLTPLMLCYKTETQFFVAGV